jgi:predicted GIY-YIG superfamily endonuclease
MIYLFHFSRPFHHAQHYLGATNDLEQRIAAHYAGRGSRLIRRVIEAGIEVAVVRTWEGDFKEERRLKKLKNNRLLCPICSRSENGSI